MSDDHPLSDAAIDLLATEADWRARAHEGQASSRPLSENYEEVGLHGEADFSNRSGLPINLKRRKHGDGGVDFIVPVRFTLDVKCFRNAIHLIQEVGKVECDIYVLAQYYENEQRAECIGWERGAVLQLAPHKVFGYGIDTHYIHRNALRGMDELLCRIMRLV